MKQWAKSINMHMSLLLKKNVHCTELKHIFTNTSAWATQSQNISYISTITGLKAIPVQAYYRLRGFQ